MDEIEDDHQEEFVRLVARVRLLERQLTSCLQNNQKVMDKFRSLEEQVGEMDGRLDGVESELSSRKAMDCMDPLEATIELPSPNLADLEEFTEPASVSDFECGEPFVVLMDHPETKPYECKFCPEDPGASRVLFDNATGLANHYCSTHHSINSNTLTLAATRPYVPPPNPVDRAIKCPKCPKSFSRRRAMMRHHRDMHSAPRYKCPVEGCGRACRRRDNLRDHLTRAHPGHSIPPKPPYTANRNPKRKIQNSRREETTEVVLLGSSSMDSSNNNSSVPAAPLDLDGTRTCPVCAKVLKSRRLMQRHRIVMHALPRFNCEFCGMAFRRKDHVKEHQIRKHGQISDSLS